MLSEDTIRRAKENRTGRRTRTWDEYEDVLDTCLILFDKLAVAEQLAADQCDCGERWHKRFIETQAELERLWDALADCPCLTPDEWDVGPDGKTQCLGGENKEGWLDGVAGPCLVCQAKARKEAARADERGG